MSRLVTIEPTTLIGHTDVAPHAFKLSSSNDEIYFQTTCADQCTKWMDILQQCIEWVRSRTKNAHFDHIFGDDMCHPLNPTAIVATLQVLVPAEDRNGCLKQYRRVITGKELTAGLLKSKIARTHAEASSIFEWLVRTRHISPADMLSIEEPLHVLESDNHYYRYSRSPPQYITLLVTLIGARALLSKDVNGFSDPYARVSLGVQQSTTRIIKRTLSPQWQETFLFVIHEDMHQEPLWISVYDHDKFGSDEMIGQVIVENPQRIKNSTQWIHLKQYDACASDSCGEICFNVKRLLEPSGASKPERNRRRRSSVWDMMKQQLEHADLYRVETKGIERKVIPDPIDRYEALSSISSCHRVLSEANTLSVLIHVQGAYGLKRADLIGHCDPYVKLLHGEMEFSTQVARSTSRPIWDEIILLRRIPKEAFATQTVRIEVHDSDLFLMDDFLGELDISLENLIAKPKQRFQLLKKGRPAGEICVTARVIDSYGITMETCEEMCLSTESSPAVLPALFYRLASSPENRIQPIHWYYYLKALNIERSRENSWGLNLYESMDIRTQETLVAFCKDCTRIPKHHDSYQLLPSLRHVNSIWIALTQKAIYIQRNKVATEKVLRIDLTSDTAFVEARGSHDLVINDTTIRFVSLQDRMKCKLTIAEIISCHAFIRQYNIALQPRAEQVLLDCIRRFSALSTLQTLEGQGVLGDGASQMHRTAGTAELEAQLPFTFFQEQKTEFHIEAQTRLVTYLSDTTPSSATQLRYAAEALWSEHVSEKRSEVAHATIQSAKDIGDNVTLCLNMIRQMQPTLLYLQHRVQEILTWKQPVVSFLIWVMLMLICFSGLLQYFVAYILSAVVCVLIHVRYNPPAPIPRPLPVQSASLLRKIETARKKKRQATKLSKKVNITMLKIRALLTSENRMCTNYLLVACVLMAIGVAVVPVRYFVAAGLTNLFRPKNNADRPSRFHRFLQQQWDLLPPHGQ